MDDKKARLLVRTLGDAPGKSKETPHAHSEQSQSAPASVGGAGTSVGHGSRTGGFFARGERMVTGGRLPKYCEQVSVVRGSQYRVRSRTRIRRRFQLVSTEVRRTVPRVLNCTKKRSKYTYKYTSRLMLTSLLVRRLPHRAKKARLLVRSEPSESLWKMQNDSGLVSHAT